MIVEVSVAHTRTYWEFREMNLVSRKNTVFMFFISDLHLEEMTCLCSWLLKKTHFLFQCEGSQFCVLCLKQIFISRQVVATWL